MKTKAEIVQKLLDENLITAEEAVVLLTNETVVINTSNHQPIQHQPVKPPYSDPYWYTTIC